MGSTPARVMRGKSLVRLPEGKATAAHRGGRFGLMFKKQLCRKPLGALFLRREPKGHAHPRGNRLRFRCERVGGLEAEAGQDVAHGSREQLVIRSLHDHARDVDPPELVHHEAHDDLSFASSRAEQRVGESVAPARAR